MKDQMPWKNLLVRIVDLLLYLIVFLLWLQLFLNPPLLGLKTVGVLTLLITSFNQYRQVTYYNTYINKVEESYLSGALECSPIHQISKIRCCFSKYNFAIGFCGAVGSSWSFLFN